MRAPIEYIKRFIDDPAKSFSVLSKELDWIQHDKIPRREYYCNDIGAPYSYGIAAYARQYQPQPWHPEIVKIRAAVEAHTGFKFEVCFLNSYLDQTNHLGWHADDSPEMDDDRPIVIVSLGAEREIWFRPNTAQIDEIIHGEGLDPNFMEPEIAKSLRAEFALPEKVHLHHGSMCIMNAGMQDTHQHRIPKSDRVCGERISLTFRGYKAV